MISLFRAKLVSVILLSIAYSCSKEQIDIKTEKNPEIEAKMSEGKAYFVAPDGDDNNPGTIEQPWKTWGKAFNATEVLPGDTVYFRGGVYMKDLSEGEAKWYYPDRDVYKGTGYRISRYGIKGSYVHFFNFPGEVPVLDCINVRTGYSLNYGIRSEVNYVHFKGLTVRNVLQLKPNVKCKGWFMSGINIIIENCVVHNVGGVGFSNGKTYNVRYINCDAYNNCDSISERIPGNGGVGFVNTQFEDPKTTIYYKNCRAWNNGDDGFSCGSIGYMEYDGCWSFNNGILEGGGNGFKMGWVDTYNGSLKRFYNNCIAVYNRASGFTTNDARYIAAHIKVFNNTSYHNGYYDDWDVPVYGFFVYNSLGTAIEQLSRIFKNNISYDNQNGAILVSRNALYSHSHNTWDIPLEINDTDFLSIDSTGIAGPRQEDGSLPDLNFLKLSKDSKLINAGVKVGLPFNGKAPDLGAFQKK